MLTDKSLTNNRTAAYLVGGGVDTFAAVLTDTSDYDLFWVDYGQACGSLEFRACYELAQRTGRKLEVYKTVRLERTNPQSLLLGKGTEPIVHLRNMEMIQVAACFGYTDIRLALLKERSVMFPDANAEFIAKAHDLYYSAYGVTVSAPYVALDKWDFVAEAASKFTFLDSVHSCWLPVKGGCRTCAHCTKLTQIIEYSRTWKSQ
jgi:7-cyano-7-deazaguanine synthase in queuosine biosynthesis